ncbi:MAG: tetratricopeptide repeat-containing sensor histidine kinase [Bacteroidales bacterium]|nr:tetratricopeptide repeat-containing sensor histidine kinase [Bacteroidales bacterium]
MGFVYYCFVSIFLFSSFYIFGEERLQNTAPDSLFFYVNSLPDDSLKVLELNELSFKYLEFQLDTAFILGQKALDISEELDFEYGTAKSLFQLGLVLRYQSNYQKAIEYSKKSYNLFEKMDKSEEKARVLNSLGNTYKRVGDYKKSVEYFISSLKIYTEISDSVKVSYVMNNLGVLYLEMGEYEKSLDFHLQNLEVRRKLGVDKELIFKTLMNIGAVYRETNENNKALDYYKEAINLIDKNTNKYYQLSLLQNMGDIYQIKRYFKSAKNYYLKALEIEEEIGEQDRLIYTLQGLGNVLIIERNYNEGFAYLLRAYNLAKDQGNLLKWKNLSESLIWAYQITGDYKNGLYYQKIYQSVSDSLLGLEKIKQITELEHRYDAEKREQQIAFLEKEQEIQKLNYSKKTIEANKKNFQKNILIIFVVFAIVFVAFLIRKNKKIIDQRAEIVDQNEKLLESNNTKDRLFQIIAHDLRSPLISMESITQLIPYWVEEQDFDSLSKLSKTLEISVNNVLSLIDNLLNWALNQQGEFPYKPENIDLKENLAETIDVYRPIAEIKNIDLKFTFSKDIMVFADRNMLFTVMRNLLNNAVKFTPEKGEIVVGIDSNQQFAKIWVKDSGIGIPTEKKKMIFELANGHGGGTKGETGKGLGLFFCKEFVKINNGDIYIESEKGKGTAITFTLPLLNMTEN